MEAGTRVLNKEGGVFGHVINDSFSCCAGEEVLVVYDGTSSGLGTDRSLLEEAEQIKAVPDFKGCGGGRGAECCIFLTVGPKGFCCERFTPLRDSLIFKTMVANREPTEPYPDCMIFNDSDKGETGLD